MVEEFARKTLQLAPSAPGRDAIAVAWPVAASKPPDTTFWPALHEAAKSAWPPAGTDHGADSDTTRCLTESGPTRRATSTARMRAFLGVWPPNFFALSATSARRARGT